MTQQQRYEAKPDPDVYYLPDHANNSIPDDIRRQFQCDAYGRILFFTSPPVNVEKKISSLGHTAKYLAWKAEREQLLKEKRKRAATDAPKQASKRARSEELEREMARAQLAAVEELNEVLADGAVAEYQSTFGDKWQDAMRMDMAALEKGQDAVSRVARARVVSEMRRDAVEKDELRVRGLTGALEFDIKT